MNIMSSIAEEFELIREEDIVLPLDPFEFAADDLTPTTLWWQTKGLNFEERMSRNAILTKWRCGAIGSLDALMAMIAHDCLDFDLCVEMLSDHALTVAKIDGEVA